MGALLALASALCYGVADFAGGLLSRRAHYATVALTGQAGGLIVALAAAVAMRPAVAGLGGLGWGALSGLGTGVGMLFLYRGMSHGAISVVVPVSAVTGVTLPVLAAVALLGEHPGPWSWSGIAVAVPALCLVSRTGKDVGGAGPAVIDGLLAGAGIAVQYLALAQAPPQAALWPVAAGRLAACAALAPLALAPLAVSGRVPSRLSPRLALAAAANGILAAAALTLYLLATRQQLLAVAVVLSSLYPAIPVLLGLTVLRERLTRLQSAGMIAAAAAVAMLTAG